MQQLFTFVAFNMVRVNMNMAFVQKWCFYEQPGQVHSKYNIFQGAK